MGAAPEAYDRHVGRYGPALARELIRIAGVRTGQRALDVGCGTGALATELAAVVGREGLAALDPSERFVEVCRSRVPDADVRVGVAEQLPFGDASFDAVLAQLVVDGMDDARRGVAEMRRVARPGGVLAACVWDFDGGMTLLCTVREAALALDRELARSFGAGKRLPFTTPGELEELWESTGLEDVETGHVEVGADYADLDDLWYPFAAGVGGFGRFYQALDEPRRAQMRSDVARRLGSPAGPFRLTARAWYVRGVVRRAPAPAPPPSPG